MTANDTTKDAESVLADVYRRMPVEQKWRQLGDLYRTARPLHEAGVRLRDPTATDHEIVQDWLGVTLEPELLQRVRESIHESAG
jgi:hypothetical protein